MNQTESEHWLSRILTAHVAGNPEDVRLVLDEAVKALCPEANFSPPLGMGQLDPGGLG